MAGSPVAEPRAKSLGSLTPPILAGVATRVIETVSTSSVVLAEPEVCIRSSSNVAGPATSRPVPDPAFEAEAGIVMVHVPGGSTPALDPQVTNDPPLGWRVWFGAAP